MKTRIIIALMLVALVAQAAPSIKTQRFVISDSIRLFEREDPDGNGYKLVKTVQMDWPVTINGKPASALTRYLLDSLFLASGANHDIVPYYPTDVNVIKDFVGDCVYRAINNNTMFDEYIKKSPLAVPDVDGEQFPLSRWTESLEFTFSYSDSVITKTSQVFAIFEIQFHPIPCSLPMFGQQAYAFINTFNITFYYMVSRFGVFALKLKPKCINPLLLFFFGAFSSLSSSSSSSIIF